MRREIFMALPGSIRADFPCFLIHQALTPSPLECEYFYTKTVGGIMHEYCGELDLSTKKGVKGGSWSKENLPSCYLCDRFTKKLSQ
jgi:hypothetical protein